jgi:hypothetical protein
MRGTGRAIDGTEGVVEVQMRHPSGRTLQWLVDARVVQQVAKVRGELTLADEALPGQAHHPLDEKGGPLVAHLPLLYHCFVRLLRLRRGPRGRRLQLGVGRRGVAACAA